MGKRYRIRVFENGYIVEERMWWAGWWPRRFEYTVEAAHEFITLLKERKHGEVVYVE